MGSEKDEEFVKRIELIQKRAQERSVSDQKFMDTLKKGIDELVKYGKEVEQSNKKYLLQYFNWIQNEIQSLNEVNEICRFLFSEKGKFGEKIIDANIRKNGYDRKLYQAVIDEIIEPILNRWKTESEFEKTLPPAKIILSNPNFQKQEITENKSSLETVKTISLPIVEKSDQKNVETQFKLPEGFKQIICEASKEEILNYFMILSREKNYLNGKCYMEEKEVEEFVKNNFSAFESVPNGKYFQINLLPGQNKTLIYFIYMFYIKYDRKLANMKMKYVMLLINNFDLFKNIKPENINTNMGESKKPKSSKNIISTENYLK